MTMITSSVPTARPAPARPAWRALRRFFRSPKGLMLLVLAGLTALAVPVAGFGLVAPSILAAVAGASVLDAAFLRLTRGAWEFPSGAVLSALFVALVLDAHEPWYVVLATAVIAINSKYVLRTRWSNIFNPAAVGLVAASFLFASGQSWWGALPDLPGVAIVIPIAATLFIARRVNKLPMILAFGGAYYAIATAVAFVGDPATVAELFRVPNINAAIFFAGFMLTDPPTSPAKQRDQLIYGAIVAIASALCFLLLGSVYYLSAGLLVGNAWETGRRLIAGRKRMARGTAGADRTTPRPGRERA